MFRQFDSGPIELFKDIHLLKHILIKALLLHQPLKVFFRNKVKLCLLWYAKDWWGVGLPVGEKVLDTEDLKLPGD